MSQSPGSKSGSLVQGLAIGGEFSAAITYVSELAAPKHRVFMTACLQVRVWADGWPARGVHNQQPVLAGPAQVLQKFSALPRQSTCRSHLCPLLNPPCVALIRPLVEVDCQRRIAAGAGCGHDPAGHRFPMWVLDGLVECTVCIGA